MKKYLVIDFNTTDFLKYEILNEKTLKMFPHPVAAAYATTDATDTLYFRHKIKLPEDITVSEGALKFHGIDGTEGDELSDFIFKLVPYLVEADVIVGHNLKFDMFILKASLMRLGINTEFLDEKEHYCTMEKGTDVCKIPSAYKEGEFKYPKLTELCEHLDVEIVEGSSANAAMLNTVECLLKMVELNG